MLRTGLLVNRMVFVVSLAGCFLSVVVVVALLDTNDLSRNIPFIPFKIGNLEVKVCVWLLS